MERRRLSSLSVLAGVILGLLVPSIASAHAELKASTPADGATIPAGSLTALTLTFSEDLADGSKVELVGPGVDLTTSWKSGQGATLTVAPPAMAPGSYELRWTSVGGDGDVLRGIVHFSVVTSTADLATTHPGPSGAASGPASTVAPAPSAAPDPGSAGAGSNATIPVIVLVVLLVVGGAWFLRGRSRPAG